MARTSLLIAAILCVHLSQAQTVGGSWYGKADVLVAGNVSNYLTELILKQKGGSTVEGIFGYYFKDTYQSFFVRGTYNRSTRQLSIPNLPLLFYASPARTGIECPMYFQGTLMVSKVRSTIKGSFYTDPKYRYTCPELRVSMTLDASETSADSLMGNPFAKRFWKPQEEDIIVSSYALKEDSSFAGGMAASSPRTVPGISSQESLALVEEFGRRNHVYEKEILVSDDTVLVSFYDNGDVDDDTISVFLNKKPILVRRGLSSRALNIYIGLDSTRETNELSMFADNMGKFPPNTALMVISDGVKRYELYLSASLKQNAGVRLRRKKE